MCGCAGGGSSNFKSNNVVTKQTKIITDPVECYYTIDILNSYKNLLTLVKIHNLYSKVGLNRASVNAHLGVLQSALNYPDNYCLFENKLDDFKNKILPKLIIHASEYLEQ